MESKMVRVVLCLSVMSFFWLFVKQAAALSVSMTVEEMVDLSQLVIVGVAQSSESNWEINYWRDNYSAPISPGNTISTFHSIKVEQVLKGDYGGSAIVVQSMGGEIGEFSERATMSFSLDKNDRYLMFLRQNMTKGYWSAIGGSVGLFKVLDPKDGVQMLEKVGGVHSLIPQEYSGVKVGAMLGAESLDEVIRNIEELEK